MRKGDEPVSNGRLLVEPPSGRRSREVRMEQAKQDVCEHLVERRLPRTRGLELAAERWMAPRRGGVQLGLTLPGEGNVRWDGHAIRRAV